MASPFTAVSGIRTRGPCPTSDQIPTSPLTATICPIDNHSQFHKVRKTGVYEFSCHSSHYQTPSLLNEAVLRIHSRRKQPWSQNQETNQLIVNNPSTDSFLFSSVQTPSNFSLTSPCLFNADLLPSRETLFYFFWSPSPLAIF